MTKTKQGRAARPNGPTMMPVGSPFNFHQLFGTTAKAQASGWQQVVRMNQECLDFLDRRLERDHELFTDLANLNDPADAWSAWVEFCQIAQRDYAEEARQLTQLYADSARTASDDIQQNIEETVTVATNGALVATRAAKPKAA